MCVCNVHVVLYYIIVCGSVWECINNVYAGVGMCIHVHVCVYSHKCMCMRVYICTYGCVHVYLCVRESMCVCCVL